MTLLSVDTSGLAGSLALAQIESLNLQGLKQVTWLKKAMHSEVATVKLQELLRQAGVELKALTHVVVNVGPGSFTGLRVGLSLGKTLAYALGIPIVGLNSLELLAFRHARPGENIFIACKAVQNFFYAAAFTRTENGVTPTLAPQSAEGDRLLALSAGHAKVLIEGQSEGFSSQTEATDLVEFLLGTRPTLVFSSWKYVEPLYIRASEAEEKLKKGLLKPI